MPEINISVDVGQLSNDGLRWVSMCPFCHLENTEAYLLDAIDAHWKHLYERHGYLIDHVALRGYQKYPKVKP